MRDSNLDQFAGVLDAGLGSGSYDLALVGDLDDLLRDVEGMRALLEELRATPSAERAQRLLVRVLADVEHLVDTAQDVRSNLDNALFPDRDG